MEVSRAQRLQEIYRRLALAPAADTFTEMRAQLDNVLNEVEDQLSGVPFDPPRWVTDGRLYPVQDDNVYQVEGHPRVLLLRARRSEVYIGDNGAIEIRDASSGAVEFSKVGKDGCGVWELA
jgi:hypothetical protein